MRALVRSTLEVAMVYGLLGWLYVATVAAVRPGLLAGPLTSLSPMRRDTFGACCFGVSALAFFALHARAGGVWVRREPRSGPVDAALRTVLVYGLLVWVYLDVNSLTHPKSMARPLTHLADGPTESTTAACCFAASAAALLALRTRTAKTREVPNRA